MYDACGQDGWCDRYFSGRKRYVGYCCCSPRGDVSTDRVGEGICRAIDVIAQAIMVDLVRVLHSIAGEHIGLRLHTIVLRCPRCTTPDHRREMLGGSVIVIAA